MQPLPGKSIWTWAIIDHVSIGKMSLMGSPVNTRTVQEHGHIVQ